MKTTRRELLRLSSAGLGSLAVLGLAGRAALGQSSGRGGQRPLAPFISIDNIVSSSTLDWTFTVRGSYSKLLEGKDKGQPKPPAAGKPGGGGRFPAAPPITCDLCHNNGTSAKSVNAAAANGYWQADFNYPTNEDGMKIVAKMTVNTKEYKAEVTDISILHNPGGLTIESDGVTLDAAGKLVDKKAQPNGKIGDDVLKVVSVYFVNGMLLGDADPKKMNTDTDGKTWKSDHTFKDGTNETGVSLVVTGFAWDNGKARLVSCSKTNLTVKA